MEMKYLYVKPELEVVELKEPLMLELPISQTPVDDEASKEQGIVDTEEELPTSPDIWSTDED